MMTTNYTHIINENLDMFDGYDYPKNMVAFEDGTLYTEEEIYAMDDYDDDYEDDGMFHFIDGTAIPYAEYLSKLREDMRKIATEQGTESSDFIELYSYYSDTYKEVHGVRPHSLDFLSWTW